MQITIRIPAEEVAKIEHIALKLGLKKSDITRMAIRSFLEKHEENETKPYEKVQSLLGIAESGIPDLGQNHRRHLIEKIKADQK
jgi:metal-responsive CopG/Arc/MetJ family transcriptional regulator